MISTGRLVQALGGRGVLRERQATFEAIIAKARTGFPYAALEALATRFEIPQETLVRVLHLPPRTLARRKKARRLSAAESDRLALSTCSIQTSGRSRSSGSSVASSTASTADPRLADHVRQARGLRRPRGPPSRGPLEPA